MSQMNSSDRRKHWQSILERQAANGKSISVFSAEEGVSVASFYQWRRKLQASDLAKFGDHLPLCREEDLTSRAGWLIRRSTMCGWLHDLAILAEPLVMQKETLHSAWFSVLHINSRREVTRCVICGITKLSLALGASNEHPNLDHVHG